jgi:hypothetical protein
MEERRTLGVAPIDTNALEPMRSPHTEMQRITKIFFDIPGPWKVEG